MMNHCERALIGSTNTCLESVLDTVQKTAKGVDFKNFLNFSYNDSICFSSDYSGEHLTSEYETYAFAFSTYDIINKWHDNWKELKEKNGYIGPISFKDIPSDVKSKKLDDFLEITKQHFEGFCVTFSIPKSIPSIFAPDIQSLRKVVMANPVLSDCPLGAKVLEKSCRIAAFSALILGFLLEDGGRHFWMTDRDSIMQGPTRASFSAKLQNCFLSEWCHNLNHITPGYSTPWSEDVDSKAFSEDFVSLSDVFAGAINEFCNATISEKSQESLYEELTLKTRRIIKSWEDIHVFSYVIKKVDTRFQCGHVKVLIDE